MKPMASMICAAALAAAGLAHAGGDDCSVGRRVTSDDGRSGAVTGAAAAGCIVELDNGMTATIAADRLQDIDAAGKPAAGAPIPGVYECTTPGAAADAAAGFTLVDAKNFRGADGKSGRYTFDAASATLKLQTDGGVLRYKRTAAKSFRPLVGERLGEASCVLNPARKTGAAR